MLDVDEETSLDVSYIQKLRQQKELVQQIIGDTKILVLAHVPDKFEEWNCFHDDYFDFHAEQKEIKRREEQKKQKDVERREAEEIQAVAQQKKSKILLSDYLHSARKRRCMARVFVGWKLYHSMEEYRLQLLKENRLQEFKTLGMNYASFESRQRTLPAKKNKSECRKQKEVVLSKPWYLKAIPGDYCLQDPKGILQVLRYNQDRTGLNRNKAARKLVDPRTLLSSADETECIERVIRRPRPKARKDSKQTNNRK